MRKAYTALMLLATASLIGACASTFVASKNGKGYYLGNGSDAAYRMFCESGDLKRIIADTSFSQQMKEELYRYNCGEDRSHEKVKRLYVSMTPAQRKDIRKAFKNNGYDINIMRC